MNKKKLARFGLGATAAVVLTLSCVQAAHGQEREPRTVTVSLNSSGASVLSESGDSLGFVRGNSADGETTEVLTVNGESAVVTVQYSPADDSQTSIAREEDANLPEPEVEVQGDQTFWSGNFGDTVERTIEMAPAPEFASAVTQTSASFEWSTHDGAEFEVTRDGEFVGTSTGGNFLNTGLKADTSYSYQLATTGIDQGLSTSRVMSVKTPTDPSQQPKVAPRAYQPYTTAFDYKTFIPNQFVESNLLATLGCGLAADEKFAGDNRGFATPGAGAPYTTPSYRTQMFFNVNWDNYAPYDLVYVKSAGETKKLNWAYNVIDRRTAGSNGMVFQNPKRSGDLVTFGISHEVGDPFCVAGAVRYSLSTVKVYRSGTVTIQGSRQPVPAHEAYARFSNVSGTETWKTLYQASGPNFACLMPSACLSENINGSVTG